MAGANHTHMASAVFESAAGRIRAKQDGPCETCPQFARCTAERICCEAFALFARLQNEHHTAERWRLAPRQPSAAIFELLCAGRPRVSEAERRQAREASEEVIDAGQSAIKMRQEAAEF